MNLGLSRKKIQISNVIGEESVQVMVDGTLEISRQKPSVERILSLDIFPKIHEVETLNGFVEVKGSIDASLFYVSKDERNEEVLSSLEFKDFLTFERNVDILGVDQGAEAFAKIYISDVDYELSGSSEVDVDVVLNIHVRASKEEVFKVVVDSSVNSETAIDVDKSVIKLIKALSLEPELAEFETVLDVPTDLPLIERLIKSNLYLKKIDAQVFGNKLVVSGGMDAEIIYKADLEEGSDSIQSFSKAVTEFSGELELPEGVFVESLVGAPKIYAEISETQFQILSAGEKISIWAEIRVRGEVEQVREVKVVTSIENNDSGIAVETRDLFLKRVVGGSSTRITVEKVFEMDYDGSIERVISCNAVPLLNKYKVTEGAVVVEGQVKIDVVYIGDFDDTYIRSATGQVPFEGIINIPGVEENMEALVDIMAEKPTYHIIGDDKISVSIILKVSSQVKETEHEKVITDAVLVKSVKREPGITIYMVQSGDTIWRISNRYAVDPLVLMAANSISGQEDLRPGMKLFIPRC